MSYRNIGLVYYDLGDFPQALENSNKSLNIFINVYGEYHPDTAIAHHNVASAYYALGEHNKTLEHCKREVLLGEHGKALDYLNKALIVYEKIYGESHPETLTLKEMINNILPLI